MWSSSRDRPLCSEVCDFSKGLLVDDVNVRDMKRLLATGVGSLKVLPFMML